MKRSNFVYSSCEKNIALTIEYHVMSTILNAYGEIERKIAVEIIRSSEQVEKMSTVLSVANLLNGMLYVNRFCTVIVHE